MITLALIHAAFMLLGAFIALWSYHAGRSNTKPIPTLHIPNPFTRSTEKPADNGKHEETLAAPRRGM